MKVVRKLFLGLGIVIPAVLVLYPWKQIVIAPAIRVRVLDEAGNPAPRALVQEKWEYRS